MILNNCGCSDYYDAFGGEKKCCAELLAVPSKKRMSFKVPCGSCCYQLKLPMITKCLTQLYNITTKTLFSLSRLIAKKKKVEWNVKTIINSNDNEQRLKKSWQRFTSSLFREAKEKNLLFTNNCQRRCCLCTIDLFLLRNDSALCFFWLFEKNLLFWRQKTFETFSSLICQPSISQRK